jgi:hypothetical protein
MSNDKLGSFLEQVNGPGGHTPDGSGPPAHGKGKGPGKGKKDESAYQKYFKAKLQNYGVTSPMQLADVKRKEFFDSVSKGWNEKN